MSNIAITGASGFVGSNLKEMFEKNGDKLVLIKREELKDIDFLATLLDGCDIVINLAGANIIHRWDEEYKKILYSSRIDTTKNLYKAIQKCKKKPELFISTSAVGIYDNQNIYDEENFYYGEDFLAKLCKDWEEEAFRINTLGVRTVVFRFGIVLGDGGALQKMLLPFKMGFGGTIGDGKQAFSFIHIEDLKNAFKFVIEQKSSNGVYNMTAPTPTTNYGLTKALGKSLHRPTILPVPTFILDLIFGEGSKVLTDGQSAVPKRLLDEGFEFGFHTIEETIEDLV